MSGQDKTKGDENTFSILPHPAKDNDPASLTNQQGFDATQARPPHTLSEEQQASLSKQDVVSGEEYRKRTEELNK